ncbi:hypothetical protein BT69DRAFT_1280547 [Atractiella rhizophila]|nr:hypothetical protein BT69DRAFT_1280547 [Atractiella rhizophila]
MSSFSSLLAPQFPPLLVEGSFLRTLLFNHQCHVEHTVFEKEMIAKTRRETKLEGSYNRKSENG